MTIEAKVRHAAPAGAPRERVVVAMCAGCFIRCSDPELRQFAAGQLAVLGAALAVLTIYCVTQYGV